MPGRPRKQRIRAPHERQFPNRVSRDGVEMTCHNCFEKGHNKKSCTKPIVIPSTKQPGKRGRPKKNMDESTSQVRQGCVGTDTNMDSMGVETGTNVDSVGVKTRTNMDSVGVESSAGNETIRSKSLGDFVSVRSEGTTTATRSRGELGFRVRRVTSEGTPAARKGRGGQTLGLRVRRGIGLRGKVA
ncbi:hypothetical protein Tco_0843860 [Tanacetum coccineum]